MLSLQGATAPLTRNIDYLHTFLAPHATQLNYFMTDTPKHPPISPLHPWLAPLAGHSDLALRLLCREHGAAVACTEMVSAKGLVYGAQSKKGSSATEDLLLTTPLQNFPAGSEADLPLVVQLFGEDADFLGKATAMLREKGFIYFDLNLGCSVPKVVKTGAGAALARDIKATLAAARAMLEAAEGRVGFKIRLGWNSAEENYLELGKALEEAGAAWLALHPRYSRQGFTGTSDWSALAKLKKCVSIPVMSSGDLFTAEDAARCMRESGVDAPMFARGALNNPNIFNEYLALILPEHPAAEQPGARAETLRRLVLRHAELARAMPEPPRRKKYDEPRPDGSLLKMRGAIPRYVKELPGSRAFRVSLATCSSWNEFLDLTESYFENIKNTGPEQP